MTWSATGGTISTAGLFTAPIVTTDQTVTVKATSVADTSKSASATATVKAPMAALSASPTNLAFTAQQGGGNPAANAISISNTGGGTLTYGAAADAAWLTVSPASGTAPKTLQVAANIAGLVPGTYTGHTTITASGAANSQVTAVVSLTIAAAHGIVLHRHHGAIRTHLLLRHDRVRRPGAGKCLFHRSQGSCSLMPEL